MVVQLTSDQEALIRKAIEAGRLGSVEEAIDEALAQWEQRERSRGDIPEGITRSGMVPTLHATLDLVEDVQAGTGALR